jgi:hypothetical protein
MSINRLTKNSSLKRITGNYSQTTQTSWVAPTADVRTPGNGSRYYVWKTVGSHTLSVSNNTTVSWNKSNVIKSTIQINDTRSATGHVFVIGGGGGGWYWDGAGAGGAVQHPSYNVVPIHGTSVPINVGGGGSGYPIVFGSPAPSAANGSPSFFGNLIGVGGGSASSTNADATWGNGCGATGESGNQPSVTHPGSNSGYTNYGFSGGTTQYYAAGGGGGIGAVGPNGNSSGYTNSSNAPSSGGAGSPFPGFEYSVLGINPDPASPTGNHFGGGGGGGSGADGWVNNSGAPGQPGGVGGGGSSGKHNGGNCHPGACGSNPGGNAINNLGGGGGGCSGSNVNAGNGGSGLVVLRVPV